MSPKFNYPNSPKKEVFTHPKVTTNRAGGVAFITSPKVELYKRIMTYLVGEPQFYISPSEDFAEILELIKVVAKEDPEFILQLAAFARTEMYLRSAPIMLLVEAVQYPECRIFIRRYTPEIVKRVDELTEAIAYYTSKYGDIGNKLPKGMLANCLKRGLADSFHSFNTYQFAKYNRPGKVKLSDVIRITHPKPRSPEENELFKQIRTNTLPTPETWEAYISVHGSTPENWQHISSKMPYMAKLRNLRNFLKNRVKMEPIIEHLTNPVAIKNSRQWPFRFYSAYKALENEGYTASQLMEALQKILEISVENIPKMSGKTFLVADVSGSMDAVISKRSSITRKDISCLMLAMAHKIFTDEVITSVFASNFAVASLSRLDTIMTNMQKLLQIRVGGSTNAYLSLEWLINQKKNVDRIIIFTDEQCWDTTWTGQSLAEQFKIYKRQVNPNAIIYVINLAGYKTVQFPEDEPNAVLIGGWSEKVLHFIRLYEEGGMTAVKAIEKYQIGFED